MDALEKQGKLTAALKKEYEMKIRSYQTAFLQQANNEKVYNSDEEKMIDDLK